MLKSKKYIIIFLLALLFTVLKGYGHNTLNKTEIPKGDNTLIWNLSSTEISSWDPHLNDSSVTYDIIHQLFEGLTILGDKGIELGVAEKVELSSNSCGVEKTIYTFKLREDARWSDGKDVTAEDFEYSFKRACNPKTNSKSIDMFTTYIKGAYEYSIGKGTVEDMMVNAIDKYTLKIELINPTPYFLEVLAMPQFIPLRQDIIEAINNDWEKNPKTCLSNGPYKLYEYAKSSYLILSKNNYYHKSGYVNIPYVKFLMNTNNKNAEEIKNAHIMPIYLRSNLKSKDILQSDNVGVYYLIFNVNKKPFNDLNVRRAFSEAVDKKFMSEQIYWGTDPAASIIPSGIKSEKSNNANYKYSTNNFDIEKKYKMLSDAGYDNISDFPKIELTVSYDIAGNALKSMFEQKLGVRCNLKSVTNKQLDEINKSGDFDILLTGWSSDYNDPMTILNNFTSFSAKNYGKWKNSKYDLAVLSSMKTEGYEREKYLIEAEKILMEDVMLIPISYIKYCYKINSELINGIKIDSLGNLIIKDSRFNSGKLTSESNNEKKIDSLDMYYYEYENKKKEIEDNGYFEDYAGNKFNEYYNSKHFQIYYNNQNVNNKIYATNLSKELENSYVRILNFFDMKEKNMPIVNIYLYPTYEQFRQSILKELYFDIDDMGGAAGYAINNNKFYIMYEKQRNTSISAIHEFVHCVTFNFAQGKVIPDWIFEGTAMYLSQEEDRNKDKYMEFIEKGLPAKYKLNDYNNRYIYGYSVIDYIINKFSKKSLLELMLLDGNIEEVLKISESQFNQGWKSFIEERLSRKE